MMDRIEFEANEEEYGARYARCLAIYDIVRDAGEDGITMPEIIEETEWKPNQASVAMRDARETFSKHGKAIPATPQGSCQPWIYRVMGGLDLAENGVRWFEFRYRTILSMVGTAVSGASAIITSVPKTHESYVDATMAIHHLHKAQGHLRSLVEAK